MMIQLSQKLLILALLPVFALADDEIKQDPYQSFVDGANLKAKALTPSSNNVSELLDSDIDLQAQPSEPIQREVDRFITQSTQKMNDESVKKEAKALVSASEKYIGESKFDVDKQVKKMESGIDLSAIIGKLRNPYQEKHEPTTGKPLPTLMVFVSASLPKPVLLELAKQTQKAGGVMVLNGFIGGTLSSTIRFMLEIVKETGVMINIDSTMFSLFNVKTVPEIIVTATPLMPCTPENQGCERNLPVHDRIKGNVTLHYALEQFAWSGDTGEVALSHLHKLQSAQWNKEELAN